MRDDVIEVLAGRQPLDPVNTEVGRD